MSLCQSAFVVNNGYVAADDVQHNDQRGVCRHRQTLSSDATAGNSAKEINSRPFDNEDNFSEREYITVIYQDSK